VRLAKDNLDLLRRNHRGARRLLSCAPEVPILGASSVGEIRDGAYDDSVVVTALGSPYLSVEVGVGEAVSAGWEAARDRALSHPGLRPFFDGSAEAWLRLTQQGKGAFAIVFSPGSTHRADSRGHDLLEALKRRSLGRPSHLRFVCRRPLARERLRALRRGVPTPTRSSSRCSKPSCASASASPTGSGPQRRASS
jgi:hypothetical protein